MVVHHFDYFPNEIYCPHLVVLCSFKKFLLLILPLLKFTALSCHVEKGLSSLPTHSFVMSVFGQHVAHLFDVANNQVVCFNKNVFVLSFSIEKKIVFTCPRSDGVEYCASKLI